METVLQENYSTFVQQEKWLLKICKNEATLTSRLDLLKSPVFIRSKKRLFQVILTFFVKTDIIEILKIGNKSGFKTSNSFFYDHPVSSQVVKEDFFCTKKR